MFYFPRQIFKPPLLLKEKKRKKLGEKICKEKKKPIKQLYNCPLPIKLITAWGWWYVFDVCSFLKNKEILF